MRRSGFRNHDPRYWAVWAQEQSIYPAWGDAIVMKDGALLQGQRDFHRLGEMMGRNNPFLQAFARERGAWNNPFLPPFAR